MQIITSFWHFIPFAVRLSSTICIMSWSTASAAAWSLNSDVIQSFVHLIKAPFGVSFQWTAASGFVVPHIVQKVSIRNQKCHFSHFIAKLKGWTIETVSRWCLKHWLVCWFFLLAVLFSGMHHFLFECCSSWPEVVFWSRLRLPSPAAPEQTLRKFWTHLSQRTPFNSLPVSADF